MLAGLAYILFAVVLAINPLVPMPEYLETGSSGFWPILIGLITLDCWAQPEGSRRLLCFPCQIGNRYFPLAFIALFAVIGGGIPFDLLAGFAVAAISEPARETAAGWQLARCLRTPRLPAPPTPPASLASCPCAAQ